MKKEKNDVLTMITVIAMTARSPNFHKKYFNNLDVIPLGNTALSLTNKLFTVRLRQTSPGICSFIAVIIANIIVSGAGHKVAVSGYRFTVECDTG
jgi:hypothetical protein